MTFWRDHAEMANAVGACSALVGDLVENPSNLLDGEIP